MITPDWRPAWHKLTNDWFYVNINKNASTSIKAHRIDGKYRIPRPKDKSFAIIRNPCDRLVSCFHNRGEEFFNPTWDAFIDHVCNTPDEEINSHARSQYINLTPKPTMLINFEHINEVLPSIGIDIKRMNFSHRGKWEDYFSPEQMERVRKRYKEDFDLWRQLETQSQVTNFAVSPYQVRARKTM